VHKSQAGTGEFPSYWSAESVESLTGSGRTVLPRIPARRWGTWDDFGGIAVYLASDASSYQTGEQFVIDGGYTKF